MTAYHCFFSNSSQVVLTWITNIFHKWHSLRLTFSGICDTWILSDSDRFCPNSTSIKPCPCCATTVFWGDHHGLKTATYDNNGYYFMIQKSNIYRYSCITMSSFKMVFKNTQMIFLLLVQFWVYVHSPWWSHDEVKLFQSVPGTTYPWLHCPCITSL